MLWMLLIILFCILDSNGENHLGENMKHVMNDKQNAVFTVTVIVMILLIFLIADLAKEDVVFSETENRVLAAQPKFSKETVLSGNYMKSYDTYVTDQFVGRDKWIAVKTVTDILLQKKKINGVYLGKENYLIEEHKPEKYPDKLEEEKLALLEALVMRWEADVMLVPTADNILTDKLPLYAEHYDQKTFLDKVRETVGENQYIDVYSALASHAGEEIYYRTDHHWTTLGAFIGYQTWRRHVGEETELMDRARRENVTEDFLGTLHSRINLPMDSEPIQIYTDTRRYPVKVVYDFQDTADSLYEESYLSTKNKYGYFLDDNHAFVEIQTSRSNGRSLFVIKDSYANCMVPLLAQHFETIYVLDLRYYNGHLFQLMEQYVTEETDVLVLYNVIHFLENFKYVR